MLYYIHVLYYNNTLQVVHNTMLYTLYCFVTMLYYIHVLYYNNTQQVVHTTVILCYIHYIVITCICFITWHILYILVNTDQDLIKTTCTCCSRVALTLVQLSV